jgi:hypothetical protein
MVGLDNYQGDGFGSFSQDQNAQELLKAMSAGQITGRDTTNQLLTQEPLKAESLEKTLKLVEFRMKDIQLWGSIPKLPAYNTVEEFLQLESYGTDRGGFYNEGELSDVEDSKYRRKAEIVKYIQVTGEVTYQAQLVKSFVDAMRKETENKTMWVIRKVNQSLTKANASVVPQEFNSLYKQHASIGSGEGDLYQTINSYIEQSQVVVDMRGASVTQENIENSSVQIDANFGNVDCFFAPPSVTSDISKDYFSKQRILLNGGSGLGANNTTLMSNVAKVIPTSFGDVALKHDKFMRRDTEKAFTITGNNVKAAGTASSLKAPNTPVAVSGALTGADAESKFAAGGIHTDALGTVFYAVSAVNRYGESALAIIPNATTAITLTAGQSVDLKWTDGGGAISASGYVVYRSAVTAASNASTSEVFFYPMFKVSVAEVAAGYDGGAATFVRDRNRFMPNTEEGFQTEMAEEVLSFKQLAPLSKLDLAILSMSRRFITFLFGTPQLYTPKKFLRYINIGPFVAS